MWWGGGRSLCHHVPSSDTPRWGVLGLLIPPLPRWMSRAWPPAVAAARWVQHPHRPPSRANENRSANGPRSMAPMWGVLDLAATSHVRKGDRYPLRVMGGRHCGRLALGFRSSLWARCPPPGTPREENRMGHRRRQRPHKRGVERTSRGPQWPQRTNPPSTGINGRRHSRHPGARVDPRAHTTYRPLRLPPALPAPPIAPGASSGHDPRTGMGTPDEGRTRAAIGGVGASGTDPSRPDPEKPRRRARRVATLSRPRTPSPLFRGGVAKFPWPIIAAPAWPGQPDMSSLAHPPWGTRRPGTPLLRAELLGVGLRATVVLMGTLHGGRHCLWPSMRHGSFSVIRGENGHGCWSARRDEQRSTTRGGVRGHTKRGYG